MCRLEEVWDLLQQQMDELVPLLDGPGSVLVSICATVLVIIIPDHAYVCKIQACILAAVLALICQLQACLRVAVC